MMQPRPVKVLALFGQCVIGEGFNAFHKSHLCTGLETEHIGYIIQNFKLHWPKFVFVFTHQGGSAEGGKSVPSKGNKPGIGLC